VLANPAALPHRAATLLHLQFTAIVTASLVLRPGRAPVQASYRARCGKNTHTQATFSTSSGGSAPGHAVSSSGSSKRQQAAASGSKRPLRVAERQQRAVLPRHLHPPGDDRETDRQAGSKRQSNKALSHPHPLAASSIVTVAQPLRSRYAAAPSPSSSSSSPPPPSPPPPTTTRRAPAGRPPERPPAAPAWARAAWARPPPPRTLYGGECAALYRVFGRIAIFSAIFCRKLFPGIFRSRNSYIQYIIYINESKFKCIAFLKTQAVHCFSVLHPAGYRGCSLRSEHANSNTSRSIDVWLRPRVSSAPSVAIRRSV
jgi:hypothetical protein